MSYVAFIPARSGSKRLPNKNVKPLAGKPLVAWTLEACAGARAIDKVIFSTDSAEYWQIAQRYVPADKLVLDQRSNEEAGDTVKIFDYLKQARERIFEGRSGSFVMTLPTIPLRESRHIDAAIELSEAKGRPVFSAATYGFPISFAFRMEGADDWAPVFPESPMVTGNTRSQNQATAYHPNGAIYVRPIEDLAKPELMTLYEGAVPYIMDPLSSVDIDAESDFLVAEALMNNRASGG